MALKQGEIENLLYLTGPELLLIEKSSGFWKVKVLNLDHFLEMF